MSLGVGALGVEVLEWGFIGWCFLGLVIEELHFE